MRHHRYSHWLKKLPYGFAVVAEWEGKNTWTHSMASSLLNSFLAYIWKITGNTWILQERVLGFALGTAFGLGALFYDQRVIWRSTSQLADTLSGGLLPPAHPVEVFKISFHHPSFINFSETHVILFSSKHENWIFGICIPCKVYLLHTIHDNQWYVSMDPILLSLVWHWRILFLIVPVIKIAIYHTFYTDSILL